jgi:hypothetical protein
VAQGIGIEHRLAPNTSATQLMSSKTNSKSSAPLEENALFPEASQSLLSDQISPEPTSPPSDAGSQGPDTTVSAISFPSFQELSCSKLTPNERTGPQFNIGLVDHGLPMSIDEWLYLTGKRTTDEDKFQMTFRAQGGAFQCYLRWYDLTSARGCRYAFVRCWKEDAEQESDPDFNLAMFFSSERQAMFYYFEGPNEDKVMIARTKSVRVNAGGSFRDTSSVFFGACTQRLDQSLHDIQTKNFPYEAFEGLRWMSAGVFMVYKRLLSRVMLAALRDVVAREAATEKAEVAFKDLSTFAASDM